MTEIARKDVVEHSMEAFVAELVTLVRDGWVVSPTNPGDALLNYGSTFTVSLYRDESTVEAFKKLAGNVADKPKMSRAETLEVAREARAANRVKAAAALDVTNVQSV